MGFWELVGMILPCLVIAALLGTLVGWLLRGARGGTPAPVGRNTDAEIWETKARSFERDLNAARADLKAQREAADTSGAELGSLRQALQARDAEIAGLQTKLDAAISFETDLATSRSRLSALDDEVTGLRARLATAETELSKPVEPDPALVAELNSLRQAAGDKDGVIRGLLARNNELAALPLQLKARDLRLREWEGKHTAALAAKDEELAQLNAALAAATTGKDEEIARLQTALAEQTAAANASAARIAELEQRAIDAEQTRDRVADLEAQSRAAATQANEAVREKDSALALLQLRVRELEPLREQVAALQTQVQHGGEREREVETLRARIAELEAAAADAPVFEARLRELEAQHQRDLADREAELNNFRLAAVEVETLRTNLADRDEQLSQLRTSLSTHESELGPLRAALTDRDAELAQARSALQDREDELLRLREASTGDLSEVKNLRAQVSDCAERLRAAESQLRAQPASDASEPELARLRGRIRDLETMFVRAQTPPPESERDDLVAIHGVGPVLAEMLNRLGIYTFKQVAQWNDEQIDWVDAQLEDFHGRIRREDWIGSAKTEHAKKYGEQL